MPDRAKDFLNAHPQLEMLELLFVDINGVARGKWLKPNGLNKLFSGDFTFPRSSYVSDIWGDTAIGTGLGMKSGDMDGVCVPVEHSIAIAPWFKQPTAQCLVSMNERDGTPLFADPRQVLQGVLDRFTTDNLTPVIALELEFYLLDQQRLPNGHPQLATLPGSNERYRETQILDIIELQDFEDVFALINEACELQNIPIETSIKEEAPGQFEINLLHHSDAMLAADQTFLLKRIIKGCAHKHGYIASFMAKPFAELSGNGLHMHVSVLDDDGHNIFKMANGKPEDRYGHAIAGLLEATPELMAFFAPHANSYRRLSEDFNLAPTTLSWGYENRTALLRLPLADPPAMRIEHRLAGADANPYLVIASILTGIHNGLTTQAELPPETLNDANEQLPAELAITWREAIARISTSDIAKEYFGERFQSAYEVVKRGELLRFDTTITDFEYDSYLRHV
jgi:glutamine synthetase